MICPSRVTLLFCVISPLLVVQSAWTQVIHNVATGTSSVHHRQQAAASIPYHDLAPTVARKIADVVRSPSIYRQLPVTTIQSDPDLYLCLVRYPEVVIKTWRLMGVTQMDAQRVAPFELKAHDGSGTSTDVELVYGTPNLNVYYAEGEYAGPTFFRKVAGRCVLVLQSDYRYDRAGEVQVTSCMHVFLKIDNLAASVIAKTVHPLVGSTADHNFNESMRFIEKLAGTTKSNGPGVQRMAMRLADLNPDVRTRFIEIAGLVYQRGLQQLKSPYSHPPSHNHSPPHHPVNPTSYRAR